MSLAKQVNHNATKINRIWHVSSTMVTRKQNLSQDLRNQTIKNIQVCPRQLYSTQNNTYKNESKHSEMGPVRQNPIQRTVSLFMCVHRTVHNCCTQYCTEQT